MEQQSPRRHEDALRLIGNLIPERDPQLFALRTATLLAQETSVPLCSVSIGDGPQSCGGIATALSEGATELHVSRIYPNGAPVDLSMVQLEPAAPGGVKISSWTSGLGSGPVRIAWLGSSREMDSVLESIGEIVATSLERALEVRRLERLATTDPLTGLTNARAFWSTLGAECIRSTRYGNPLSVAVIDLDDFKGINDRLGHLEGDRVLRAAAAVMVANVRETDLVARLGGDEFALLLRESDADAARIVAQRILDELRAIDAGGRSLRASVGVAELHEGATSPETLVDAADRALYSAKRRGRDRVSSFAECRQVA